MRRLIIRPGGIGDTILALPAMEWLKADYTEVWVRREVVPLVRFADRVRAIADTGLDLVGLPGVEPPRHTMQLLGSFDQIYSWYGESREDFRRVLLDDWGRDVRFLAALPQQTAMGPAADFFAHQVNAPVPAIPSISVEPGPWHGAVCIHPYSGSPAKNWPLSKYVELSKAVAVEWVAREDWVRFADLGELASWLAGARAFVGNDSGITHLAAAVGIPTVALFGPTDPAVWAPPGDKVRIVRGRTMDDIGVDEVVAALRGLGGK